VNKYNAISVSYNDVISYMEKQVDYLKRTKDSSKAVGRSAFFVDHNLECAERILTLLKKHKKEPQGNLFDQFQNTRK
jgi:hypothetical protein